MNFIKAKKNKKLHDNRQDDFFQISGFEPS